MVSTSCFVLAGTAPKLSAGLTPPPCASQVYFDGIFSPCLNAGDVSSSANAVCAMSSPPAMNATVPLGRLLECMRERQHSRFAEVRSADLQTDRETGAAEAARNGNGRQAVD